MPWAPSSWARQRGHHPDRRLRDRVHAGGRPLRCHRRQRDHRPAVPCLDHQLRRALAGQEDAAQVDVHHEVEAVDVQIGELADAALRLWRSADAGRCDHRVDASHQFRRTIHGGAGRGRVAHVDLDEVGDTARVLDAGDHVRRRVGRTRQIGEHDGRAFRREQLRDRGTQSVRPAGDDRPPPLQPSGHVAKSDRGDAAPRGSVRDRGPGSLDDPRDRRQSSM